MNRLSILFFLAFTAPISLWSANKSDLFLGLGLGYECGAVNNATAGRFFIEYDYNWQLLDNLYLVPAFQLGYTQRAKQGVAPDNPTLNVFWLSIPVRLKYEVIIAKNIFLDVESGVFGSLRLAGCDDLTEDNKYYHNSNWSDVGPSLRIGPRFKRVSIKFEGQYGLIRSNSSVHDNLLFFSIFIGYCF